MQFLLQPRPIVFKQGVALTFLHTNFLILIQGYNVVNKRCAKICSEFQLMQTHCTLYVILGYEIITSELK